MIRNINITDEETKNILLFDEVKNVRKLNILFGGNGVGKTTFLNSIRDGKVALQCEGEKEILIKSFTNSVDNMKLNVQKREIKTTRDAIKLFNSSGYSEGQTILHYVLSFLHDIKGITTEKQIVVLLDEMDSGLSAENINLILWQIQELILKKNVQFFISSNHYHFVYAFKNVLNMYDGNYIKITSYDEYFEHLKLGIPLMKNSQKRDFGFLDIY